MPRFGKKSRFAIEVGEFSGDTDSSRRVDVWAAEHWLTCDDNSVYVPHFAGCLQHAVGRLLSDPQAYRSGRPYPELSAADNHRRLWADVESGEDGEHRAYQFMDWGPTVDNVRMHLFREGGTTLLPFSFWREDHHDPSELGQVFVAELPEWELARVLHDAAWILMWDWADRSKWPKPAQQHATAAGADRALAVAQADALTAYGDLSGYRIQLVLEDDGWHVDYELKDPRLKGGGPHYLIDSITGAILCKRYEQ